MGVVKEVYGEGRGRRLGESKRRRRRNSVSCTRFMLGCFGLQYEISSNLLFALTTDNFLCFYKMSLVRYEQGAYMCSSVKD